MISPQVAQHQFALFFHQSVHQANQLSSRRKTWNSELNPLPSLQLPLTLFSELMELLRDEIPPPPSSIVMALKFNSTRNSRTDQMPITNAVRYSGSLGRCRPLQWGQNDFICAYNYNRLCRKNRSIIRACSALCRQTVDIIRDGQRSRSLILIFKITTGDLDLLGGKDH